MAALFQSAEDGHQHGMCICANFAAVSVAVFPDDYRRTHLALGMVVVEWDPGVIQEREQVALVPSQPRD